MEKIGPEGEDRRRFADPLCGGVRAEGGTIAGLSLLPAVFAPHTTASIGGRRS
jgi:hypothetical protein